MELHPISYEAGGGAFTGFLADGSGGRTAPGVLVAHEGGGLTDHVKDRTRMLADLGYVAFAMDLFGESGRGLEQAQALVRRLRSDPAQLRLRARAALDVLKAQPGVDADRLAAIGFCFGGLAVLELARSGAPLACTVGFHAGLASLTPDEPAAIKGRVLVCQGADDPIIGAAEREAFAAEMTAAGVDWQMLLLGGVAHSFTNPEIDAWNFRGFAYDEAADRRSWRAMRQLLEDTFAT